MEIIIIAIHNAQSKYYIYNIIVYANIASSLTQKGRRLYLEK